MVHFLIPFLGLLGIFGIILGAADISRGRNPVVAYLGAIKFLGGVALLTAAALWLFAA